MLKLAKKLAIVLVPVVIYFGIFVYFEPYNYFGIKQSEYNGDSAIVRVKNFNSNPADVIILGDSKMAHFDMDKVESLVGERVSQLSFGGASFNESIDLFYYAVEENPQIHTVYFGASFYTLNKSYYKDRMSSIKTIAENPFAYMLNFNYNVEMLNEIKWFLMGEKNVASTHHEDWKEEDFYNEDGTKKKFRRNLEEYADTIYGVCTKVPYEVDTEDVDRYLEMAQYCRDNGIRLITVMPPMEDSLKELVVQPLGIDKHILQFIDDVDDVTEVRNFEYNEKNPFTQEQFYDGFHLDTYSGLPVFTEMLFGE
ncbi:MAG: hypothetical protein IKV52_05065 [Oscillospiraceae bacterium]|nr:hypothetical protein [Oscillospiraceae bacterium]